MPKDSRDISATAADLVRQNVDVIVTGGPEASLKAARRATSTIPIVMVALNNDSRESLWWGFSVPRFRAEFTVAVCTELPRVLAETTIVLDVLLPYAQQRLTAFRRPKC
jgi:hypothetical protein